MMMIVKMSSLNKINNDAVIVNMFKINPHQLPTRTVTSLLYVQRAVTSTAHTDSHTVYACVNSITQVFHRPLPFPTVYVALQMPAESSTLFTHNSMICAHCTDSIYVMKKTGIYYNGSGP